jgi:RNA polymerase sigma-70 factor (ECF subfamily)
MAPSEAILPAPPPPFCSGDADATPSDELTFDALVARYHVPLYRYAFRLAGNAADAEDLVQQAFVVAYRKRQQVREPERLSAWMFAVLRSCFLKSRRRPIAQPASPMELNLDHLPDNADPPQEIDSQQLQLVLDELPPEYKIVVVMFYFEHCSYKEIAQRLETPIGTVMSRLARAKERLRARLAEYAPAIQSQPSGKQK